LRTGQQYLNSLRDGRAVYIDGAVVEDVSTHPAFRGAVRSIARLYDVASDPANADVMTAPSPYGREPINVAHMIPRSKEDLVHRRRGLRRWSEETYGLMGRSPDHVASFIAGFAGNSSVFARGGKQFAANIVRFHQRVCEDDLYLAYVIVPPQIDRSKPAHQQSDPFLYAGVKEEVEGGIIIKGAQMLGTGAALADWIYLSSIFPLRPGDENYALSLVVPVAAPGVKIFSRRSYAAAATSTFDYPLSSRFDETDALVVFDDVFVPWEQVFAFRNREVVAAQWWETSAHVLGNNQAQIRFATKLDLLTGIAHRIAEMNGTAALPPVQGMLGELAAYTSMVGGLVYGAEQNCTIDADGVAVPGRAETYANMTLQSDVYPKLLGIVRELCGGGVIQLPSSVEDFRDPEIAATLERYIQSPGHTAQERVKLLKLAWDLIGSEFASRHQQYEMFYAGAPFVVKMRMYQNFDFSRADGLVERMLASYDLNGPKSGDEADLSMTTA
jgi:4-hydroxyphenylacetate 3-monooxygenase